MAFSISNLSSAVNSYLNSISSVSNRDSDAYRSRRLGDLFNSYFNQYVQSLDIRSQIESSMVSHNRIEVGKDNAVSETSAAKGASSDSGTNTNSNAYANVLSTEALRELSGSSYYTALLLKDALTSSDITGSTKEEEDKNTITLDKLNKASLDSSSLDTTYTQNAYWQKLIEAYTSTGVDTSSVFGNFIV